MTSKEKTIANFDPNGPGTSGTLFGLPFNTETAELIIIPIPWEVTVSYNAGTADAPEAILEASEQVDLFVRDIPNAWKLGISMLPISSGFKEENQKFRDLAFEYIQWLQKSEEDWTTDELKVIPATINEVCEKLNIYVRSKVLEQLDAGKMVALLGGDHSTPFGFIAALTEKYSSFGILQIDAHADLRKAYEDFTYSHASIMYNVLKMPQVSKLVQVGIRDLCEEEAEYIRNANGRVITFYDEDIKQSVFEGNTWGKVCEEIIVQLPQLVYISFDIDGMDPKLCPNTGTPVPGGLEYHQVMYLFRTLVKSGRTIIGFDLNEVSPGQNDWDANVGARILYQLGNLMAVSQGKLSFG